MTDDAATARRIIELLWRREQPARRGPRPRVSVDDVVRAGVQLADADGLSKLSIRSVATRLGLRPMSVYTYVPSKDVLVALMVDSVAAEDGDIGELSLPDRLAAIADQYRDELVRHPWLLTISMWRPVLGPHLSARYERHLAVLEGSGPTGGGRFDDVELDTIVAALRSFATGSARAEIDARSASTMTGLTDEAWWEIYGPLLAEVMTTQQFPVSSRVGATVGELYQAPGDTDAAYRYGLARLIDGIVSAPRSTFSA
ncbi:TetR/AcrR family transcriptional regulator [Gordonia sp. CPCC 205333]|uniref:TetR/AcrR family transcriptional regulator n=1 Tax=Gordonia sp. CPCC 205333 TaxID=3140790 RepID=UPI003AF3E65C